MMKKSTSRRCEMVSGDAVDLSRWQDHEVVRTYSGCERRRSDRFVYLNPDIEFFVQHPGGGQCRIHATGRDLGAGGLCLYHVGFLYPRSLCECRLRRADGDKQIVGGTIAHCHYISETLHLVGVQAAKTVKVEEYIPVHAQRIASRVRRDDAAPPETPSPLAVLGESIRAVLEPPNLAGARCLCEHIVSLARQNERLDIADLATAALRLLQEAASVARAAGMLAQLAALCAQPSQPTAML